MVEYTIYKSSFGVRLNMSVMDTFRGYLVGLGFQGKEFLF